MSNIFFSSSSGEYRDPTLGEVNSFLLTYNDLLIFERAIESERSEVVRIPSNTIRIVDHFYSSGEEIQYSYSLENQHVPIGIQPTIISGVPTSYLPEKLYVIKVSNIDIRVAATAEDALADPPRPLIINALGIGQHKFLAKNQNKKCLISLDNVVQAPIIFTSVSTTLEQDIASANSIFEINDISNFKSGDIIKIDNEYMKIFSVGIGTTAGNFNDNEIKVERPFLGTKSEPHFTGATITKMQGNYNIIDNIIYFSGAPYGNELSKLNPNISGSDLEYTNLDARSKFSGRVFLRSGVPLGSEEAYETNYLFDSLSEDFDGYERSFTLKSNGQDIVGFSTDNAIILINDILQTPSRITGTPIENDFFIEENTGISSITFVGTAASVAYDVNTSQLPRGGIIFSIGSTEGFGYQPTVSAGGTAIVSLAGTIQSISIANSGSGYRSLVQPISLDLSGTTVSISTSYNNLTVRGSLYYPTSNYIGSSVDVIVLYHPSIDSLGVTPTLAASNFINIITSEVNVRDKIIFSVAYPQDAIPSWLSNNTLISQEFPELLANYGGSYANFLFGDNIEYAESALLWVKNSLNSYLSSIGISKTIDKVFTFGHSQGAYLVHRLNTMHPVDGVISNAPGPIDLLDRCGGSQNTINITCNKIRVGLGSTEINPEAYNTRSLKSYLSGTLSPTLFTQALDDDPYQVNLMQNTLQVGLSTCTTCEEITFKYYSTGGHPAFVTNKQLQEDIREFFESGSINNIVTPVKVGVKTETDLIEYIGTATIQNGNVVGVNITNSGSGYSSSNPPKVVFDPPLSYWNLPLKYSSSSQPGVGTEATIDIVVGQGSSIIGYDIRNLGFGYKPGDILTVDVGGTTGIPTNTDLQFEEFQVYVTEVKNDEFNGWSMGEFQVIDDIDDLFDGQRRVFPISINGNRTSIRPRIGFKIDLFANLIITINNVLQVPQKSYFLKGGSLITFTEPPRKGDKCRILFYRGTKNVDTKDADILETIKEGDRVRIYDRSKDLDQFPRTVEEVLTSDTIRTNIYGGQGITSNEDLRRPLIWCRQTEDMFINGKEVTKDRIIYEPLIFPETYLIQPVSSSSTVFFVENIKTFFDSSNEYQVSEDSQDKILLLSQEEIRPAVVTPILESNSISNFDIIDSGIGYATNPSIIISSPIGIGDQCTATTTIDGSGQVTSISIVNPGTGYTSADSPVAIIEEPSLTYEIIQNVLYEGDFGTIVGVGTTSIGQYFGIYFDLHIPINSYIRSEPASRVGIASTGISQIKSDYYFKITNSNIGNNINSLRIDNSSIGISTNFMDNVYQVYDYDVRLKSIPGIGVTYVNTVLVKVDNLTGMVGIASTSYFGDYSWGKITSLRRRSPKAFKSYPIGITSSTIVRRYNPLKYLNYFA